MFLCFSKSCLSCPLPPHQQGHLPSHFYTLVSFSFSRRSTMATLLTTLPRGGCPFCRRMWSLLLTSVAPCTAPSWNRWAAPSCPEAGKGWGENRERIKKEGVLKLQLAVQWPIKLEWQCPWCGEDCSLTCKRRRKWINKCKSKTRYITYL